MTDDLIFSQEGQLGLISLNRPKALNALSLEMVMAMRKQLKIWERDDSVAVVMIQSAGGKAFCAGGDVRWLYERGKEKDPSQLQFFDEEYQLNLYIGNYPKPYIALMDGITMGGGVGISLHGSHPVATEHFQFAMPETGIGFFPDIGASHLLAACPGALGVYLGLTGRRLNASQAMSAGLIHCQIHSEQIPELIQKLSSIQFTAHAKEQVSDCLSVLTQSGQHQAIEQLELINRCFSHTDLSSVFQALSEEQGPFAEQLLAELKQKAPLSLAVTLLQIHRAQGLSLADCLDMDSVLVRHFMAGHDFYEGIRALLVDKDKSPVWQPASIQEVTAPMVEQYFMTGFSSTQ